MRLTPVLPALSGAFALPLTVALAAITHCGGSTATPAEGPADATSTAHDAAAEAGEDAQDSGAGCGFACDAGDEVTLVACPSSAPQVGSACSLPEAEECEYGGSWWLGCNFIVRCTQGVWQAAQAGQACVQQDAGGTCPATWAEASGVGAGIGMCPAPGCQYPEGYCECLVGCGGGGAIRPKPQIAGHWYCAASTPQCPSPRPDLGTSCGDSDAGCQYGTACGCGEQLYCTGGVWQGFALPPCP
jgi:hypothetical protein